MSDKTLFNLLDAGKTEEEIVGEITEKFNEDIDAMTEPDWAAEPEDE